jgi:membrane metallo-endopeptidase-like protein 1
MIPDFRDEEGFDWQKTITRLREYNNDILVALWVGPDGKDSDDYIVQVLLHLNKKLAMI